jgi:hypothetical protein
LDELQIQFDRILESARVSCFQEEAAHQETRAAPRLEHRDFPYRLLFIAAIVVHLRRGVTSNGHIRSSQAV